MAEYLLKTKAASEKGCNIEVASAGLAAFPGVPIAPEAKQVLQEKGILVPDAKSRPLGKEDVLNADLILTMTGKHRDAILAKMPSLRGKVWQIFEFVSGKVEDVPDPAGQGLEAYRSVCDQLEKAVETLLKKIHETSGGLKT